MIEAITILDLAPFALAAIAIAIGWAITEALAARDRRRFERELSETATRPAPEPHSAPIDRSAPPRERETGRNLEQTAAFGELLERISAEEQFLADEEGAE